MPNVSQQPPLYGRFLVMSPRRVADTPVLWDRASNLSSVPTGKAHLAPSKRAPKPGRGSPVAEESLLVGSLFISRAPSGNAGQWTSSASEEPGFRAHAVRESLQRLHRKQLNSTCSQYHQIINKKGITGFSKEPCLATCEASVPRDSDRSKEARKQLSTDKVKSFIRHISPHIISNVEQGSQLAKKPMGT